MRKGGKEEERNKEASGDGMRLGFGIKDKDGGHAE
jgi:hypothetical protein